jgi:hypothetical protein
MVLCRLGYVGWFPAELTGVSAPEKKVRKRLFERINRKAEERDRGASGLSAERVQLRKILNSIAVIAMHPQQRRALLIGAGMSITCVIQPGLTSVPTS